MENDLVLLSITAASIGFFHTILGPDHYLPFIAMSKSGKWSIKKTSFITILCGLGHVASSVVLGIIGISLGLALSQISAFESFTGNLAAWLLIVFGFIYFIWGMKQAIRNKPHTHLHLHKDGSSHSHTHSHKQDHLHVHEDKKANMTPWVLFAIFVFGPCEPLIPLLMYPAAKESLFGLFAVVSIFGLVTILTMLAIVLVSSYGIQFIEFKKLEKYTHALAGATLFLSGAGIQFLGL